jgi:hypothetical protein
MTGLGVPAADPAPGEPRAITTIRRAVGAGRQSAITAQNGGSARGYQAIFVPSTALASPGYDRQPAVYSSLSHKRRACLGADPALEIMVYAAEFPVSAA